jgi:8-oxo-dGTP pyrophosphatase MutT (NUDIX family)
MHEVRACGVLVVQGEPIEKFLLMRHAHRLDLPKGHLEVGETDEQCALREMFEETGIHANDIELHPTFRFVHDYHVRYRSFNNELAHKTLVIFLARLKHPVEIKLSEHAGYVWQPWQPPHQLQRETIDPLLAAVERHLAENKS